MKPVRLSEHARKRALLRGASEEEIRDVLQHGIREPARHGKWQARWQFHHGSPSPVDGKRYNEKTVEVIFADHPEEFVVVTVKVYYSGLEVRDED